jgi:hypothetical protein
MPQAALLILLALTALAPLGAAAYQAGFAPPGQASLTVMANAPTWTNSGFRVERGQSYGIRAEGRWRVYPPCPETGPDGANLYSPTCWNVLITKHIRDVSHGALIARIGEGGKPFAVGDSLDFEAQADGVLYFSINDNIPFDNTGSVRVTIGPGLGGATPVPAQTPAPSEIAPPAPKPQAKSPAASTSGRERIQEPQPPLTAPAASAPAAASPAASSPPSASPSPASGAGTRPAPAPSVDAGRRMALVIGNAAYANAPLANPVNDARDVAAALTRQGFQTTVAVNADRRAMIRAVQDFGRQASGAVALFYFAGHGVQSRGENYLIPVGADIRSEADVEHEAVPAGRILASLEDAGARLNIVILDACRDAPFARGFRSQARGLAFIAAPKGTIVAYATAPGDVALDGTGRNSPYAAAILRNLPAPGLGVEAFFKEVGRDVDRATGGRQRPWMSSDFLGDFSFAR